MRPKLNWLYFVFLFFFPARERSASPVGRLALAGSEACCHYSTPPLEV